MTEIKYNNEITDNPNQTFWINNFENCKSPAVLGKISIEEFLHKIKHGDENLLNIKNAREYGKGHLEYNEIKIKQLPTFRFNFLYKDYAKDINVKESTGLIYIDVDENKEILDSEYVFAKWRSLSNTGYGILVKVNNLSLNNFKDVYSSLGTILEVNVDYVAGKAIQQNVLSYDPNLYYNTNSKVYECKISKKAPFSSIKKEKKGIVVNDASIQERIKERVDNTHEYFVGENYNKDYLYFENYVNICAPFMPWHGVNEGNRNNLLFRILSQFALLNPKLGKEYLLEKGQYFNKKMNPKLTLGEIHSIIHSVIEKRKEGTLEFYYNQKRLIIYNPDKKLTRSEKCQITGAIVGGRRSKKTQLAIYQIIENWDFEEFGKITQKLVIDISKFSRRTVQNHWIHFKDYVEDLNKEFNRKSA